jgi:hypothetical protein
MKQHIILQFSLMLLFLLVSSMIFSQERSFCNDLLLPIKDTEYSYIMRGNRCEGAYFGEGFSGRNYFELVSFTREVENYDLQSGEPLLMYWNLPNQVTEDIQVLAQGVVAGKHYRMDSQVPVNNEVFEWTTEILASLNFTREQLGVLSWSKVALSSQDSVQQNVHFPPSITQKAKDKNLLASGDLQYQLQIIPILSLTEVYVKVRGSQDGQPNREVIVNTKVVEYGDHFYKEVISFPLFMPQGTPAGYYYLEIKASLAGNGGYELSLWFYHAGN